MHAPDAVGVVATDMLVVNMDGELEQDANRTHSRVVGDCGADWESSLVDRAKAQKR